ncbi:class I SAM-dependent methyltransferase [Motilibacter rhizosphaerae]|uniref:class I SAM-dependent methyltransferase n=1 Tax=Motilibacter rhizosphaerae TaxID=598652 RepID=UPI001E4DF5D9|nr:class I SAM-dependent methyltransferase [Motilibacter rhizosphaerae]
MERVRASYDAVAAAYAAELSDELARKPLDRAMLAALVELRAGEGPLADVGCGPGHVAAHLAALGAPVVGVDLSPAMVAEARRRHPGLSFAVGSLLDLAVADAGWSGAVCVYAVIHLDRAERAAAYAELARAVAPGGRLLLAFHVSAAGQPAGSVLHADELFGVPVELEFRYLDPDDETALLLAAGWALEARLEREPVPGAEHASRRAYLLARRA